MSDVCLAGALGLSGLGVVAWFSLNPVLPGLGVSFTPVEPTSSLALLVLACILLLDAHRPWTQAKRSVAMAVAGLVGLLSLLSVLAYVTHSDLTPEALFLPPAGAPGLVHRMSPVSGAMLTASAISLVLILWSRPASLLRHTAAVVAGLVVLTGGTVTLGYVLGAAPLYGGQASAVSQTIGLGLFFLGGALLAAAGSESFILRVMIGGSVRARLLRTFLPLTGGIVLVQTLMHYYASSWSMDRALSIGISALFLLIAAGIVVSLAARAVGSDYDRAQQQRAAAEQALRQSEERYELLFHMESDALFLIERETLRILEANAAASALYGYTREELLTMRNVDLSAEPDRTRQATEEQFASVPLRYHRKKDGTIFPVEIAASHFEWQGRAVHLAAVRDITDRLRAEETLRASERRFREMLETVQLAAVTLDTQGNVTFCNNYLLELTGWRQEEVLGHSWFDRFIPPESGVRAMFFDSLAQGAVPAHHENDILTRLGERRLIAWNNTVLRDGQGNIIGTASIGEDITERKRAEEALRSVNRALRMIIGCNQALVRAADTQQLLDEICHIIVEVGQYRLAWVGFAEQDEAKTVRPVAYAGHEDGYLSGLRITWADTERGRGPTGTAIRTRRPYIMQDIRSDPASAPWREEAQKRGYAASIALPLVTSDETLGALSIYAAEPNAFGQQEVHLLAGLADDLAYGLVSLRARTDLARQLAYVQALLNIDRAISGSLDLRVTLDILVSQVANHLRVDAVDILLFQPESSMLTFAAGRGFRTRTFHTAQVRLDEDYAGRCALERRIVEVPDWRAIPLTRDAADPASLALRAAAREEGFAAYYAAPLVAKGQIKGVLEIYHRTPLPPDPQRNGFLQAFATQAAIAIDNAELFQQLQRSNADLMGAYDATIEGWSRAMDLRDKETEGHTRRVTEMTERLARAMGIRPDELAHMRRGALLHDIGKMGVPDAVLLKPGPLTDEEWVLMRRHPVLAYEMLSSIAYLRPALDIPYCHHERWDGSGYPRGLKGEEIPLAARIFAVVDVWDALRSDRPYRPAWPAEKVRAYIQEEAGKQFDPRVVDMFLAVVAGSPR